MLRSLVKSGMALGLHATHADRAVARFSQPGHVPLVVGYHRTVERFPTDPRRTIPSMCITTTMLERQLDWIGRRFQFVPLDDLNVPPRGKPAAAVTFDDAYADFYQLAFPLLKRKGIPAAVFVVTDLAGTSQLLVHDLLYLLLTRTDNPPDDPHAEVEAVLHSLPFADVLRVIETLEPREHFDCEIWQEHRVMNWEELAKVQSAGITIGSHTQSHALLPNESLARVRQELAGSKQLLESRLGKPVHHFAYPCGSFDTATVRAVNEAGYRFAYSICQHRDPCYQSLTIPRRVLWEKSSLDFLGSFSPAIMSCQINGSFDFFAGCKAGHSALERAA